MKVTIETKLGKIDEKDFIEHQIVVGDTRGNISRHIYETIDKQILENMPQSLLEVFHEQIQSELNRRRIDK